MDFIGVKYCPPKDLSYSVKHCCSECCFSEHWPFRWHGQPAVQWPWKQMCLNEQDTDMREGAMFSRAFHQLLRVLHDTMPSSDKKKLLVWRKTSQTRFSSLSDKHRCHGFYGFDRKVVSLIWIAVVVIHCCSWAHVFLDPDRHLLPATEVVCFRTIHTTVRYSSPLLWASSLVRQESTLHSTSSQSQTWERERVTKRVGSFVE